MKKIFSVFILILVITCNINTKAFYVQESEISLKKGQSIEIPLYLNLLEKAGEVEFCIYVGTKNVNYNLEVLENYTVNKTGMIYNVKFEEEQLGRVLIGTLYVDVSSNATEGDSAIIVYGEYKGVNTVKANDLIIDIKIADVEATNDIIGINQNNDLNNSSNNQTSSNKNPLNNTNNISQNKKQETKENIKLHEDIDYIGTYHFQWIFMLIAFTSLLLIGLLFWKFKKN